ncbi:peptidyl-tRNA hydrolase, putative [Ichthyophthirius multifiliis]|uniref:peptidyl-tRNA hydrolase n=1 Tax=Ichthyophthirius multifiliis TaxID=5932 RepID=G0R0M6_ICHMU|nr:peptidyl-tRNA hydrolase, putative [Ichthyophthirius multifiliis]EGR28970.1 peptidyl-tRNA hydrolase, putative [Ichthyophthirius multifiliis]|eukprot:XP_004030206.1 peptidyl-tRNA hydrolase, putative [Ichthyophthirius multifiliis]
MFLEDFKLKCLQNYTNPVEKNYFDNFQRDKELKKQVLQKKDQELKNQDELQKQYNDNIKKEYRNQLNSQSNGYTQAIPGMYQDQQRIYGLGNSSPSYDKTRHNVGKMYIYNKIIIHDDLDNKFGQIKLKNNGSAQGHNGVKSVINWSNTDNFMRIKIGIGRPESRNAYEVANYVIQEMSQVIMPLPNPSGYIQNRREEQQQNIEIDMNRDFPYDQKPYFCFKTAGARSINKIWKQHLFQAAITFHAGMYAIGWPYGSNNHISQKQYKQTGEFAPDQKAFFIYGKRMADQASFSDHILNYPYDTLTNSIYAVPGTFEDWSYAASWEPKISKNTTLLAKCQGISAEELEINDVIARSLTYLIEVGEFDYDSKKEGTWEQIGYANKGIGHISRNIRLTLDFIKNLTPQHIIKKIEKTNIEFQINGCFNVEKTRVFFMRNSSVNMESENFENFEQLFKLGFQEDSSFENQDGVLKNENFYFKYEINEFTTQVVLVSKCDQDWKITVENSKPDGIGPQTHIIQRKINKKYYAENNGFQIRSKMWFANSFIINDEINIKKSIYGVFKYLRKRDQNFIKLGSIEIENRTL